MSSLKARRYGVATVLLVSACRADQPVAPNSMFLDTPTPAFGPGVSNYASYGDSTDVLAGVSSNSAPIVIIPTDTVRLPGGLKLSRARRQVFSTSNAAVATVDQVGLARAVSVGSALLISSDGAKIDSFFLRVEAGPARVVPTPASISAAAGEKRQISAVVTAAAGMPLFGHTVRYSTQNAAIASVTPTGLMTAVSGGQTAITVTDGATSTSIPVTVQQAPPGYTATSFALTPDAPTLQLGGSQQFNTFVSWSDGVSRSASVTYTATGGTVSMSGLFTAGSVAGQFRVIALCACGLADTALVAVVGAPRVQAIAIAPKAVTLEPGASQTFTVSALWTNGSTAVPLHAFSATGGSVNAAGVYTAPATAGTYRVVVAETAGPLRDTAVVTVQTPPVNAPAPPPPPPPAGALFTDDFESGGFNKKQNGISWTSIPWVEVSSMIAHTGKKSVRFRQGESKDWTELRFGGLPHLKEVFMQYYLYMPNGLESPHIGTKVRVLGSGVDKFFQLWGGDYEAIPGIKVGAVLVGDDSKEDGSLITQYRYADPTGQWPSGEGPWFLPAYPRKPFVSDANRGRWLQIRWHVKTATAANNDGVIEMWLDGQLLISRTNLVNANIYGSGPMAFTDGYLLGWANNGYAPGQNMFIDDFSISGTSFPP